MKNSYQLHLWEPFWHVIIILQNPISLLDNVEYIYNISKNILYWIYIYILYKYVKYIYTCDNHLAKPNPSPPPNMQWQNIFSKVLPDNVYVYIFIYLSRFCLIIRRTDTFSCFSYFLIIIRLVALQCHSETQSTVGKNLLILVAVICNL